MSATNHGAILKGFSLLELCIGLAISAICCTYTIPVIHSFIYRVHAHLTFNQIEMAIRLGRSLALQYAVPITICPSNDGKICSQEWRNKILVITPKGKISTFRIFLGTKSSLNLRQSGFKPNEILIQADGFTHTNGSFRYQNQKVSEVSQFKLYFNKRLRVYRVFGLWVETEVLP